MITEIPFITDFTSLDQVSIKWGSDALQISGFWGHIVDEQNRQSRVKLRQLTSEYKNEAEASILEGRQLFQVIIPETFLGEKFIHVNLNGIQIKSLVKLNIGGKI